jgi:hypothetical protein
LGIDLTAALGALAGERPVFHSERDLQHALAWQLQVSYPDAQVRLETRPRRGIHLDMLITAAGKRTAIELKYLVAGLHAVVGEEEFDLPHQSANDISRHDVIKDITRVETLLAAEYADIGHVLVLSNDRSYWQPGLRADTIDAAFRIHEDRVLAGNLAWAVRAETGTTTGRDAPLILAGTYTCRWHDYSHAGPAGSRAALFRYLLIDIPASGGPTPAASPVPEASADGERPAVQPSPRPGAAPGTARSEILNAARELTGQSADGTFTITAVLAQMRRAGTAYQESTIRTHITSRMCGDAPDHHGTTYDDFQRIGDGRYRLRHRPEAGS